MTRSLGPTCLRQFITAAPASKLRVLGSGCPPMYHSQPGIDVLDAFVVTMMPSNVRGARSFATDAVIDPAALPIAITMMRSTWRRSIASSSTVKNDPVRPTRRCKTSCRSSLARLRANRRRRTAFNFHPRISYTSLRADARAGVPLETTQGDAAAEYDGPSA